MNWYLTKMVFRIICGNGQHKAQFDEQIRLIHATDPSEAWTKARQYALAETGGIATNGVTWQFVNIPELYQINGFVDGAELYSRVKEEEDGEVYEQVIHRRAAMLQYNMEHQILSAL
jgi:Domain of unknown function (DUF4288)